MVRLHRWQNNVAKTCQEQVAACEAAVDADVSKSAVPQRARDVKMPRLTAEINMLSAWYRKKAKLVSVARQLHGHEFLLITRSFTFLMVMHLFSGRWMQTQVSADISCLLSFTSANWSR